MANDYGAGYAFRATILRKRLEMADRPEAYLEYFDQLILSEHTAFGEISPSYSMLPASGFAAMRRMLPEPRLIWILRNPVDRFWSQLRFWMRRQDGFSAEDQFCNMLDAPQFVYRTDYARTLNHVFSEFTHEEVLVIFYENLFFGDQRDREICRITTFLGIDNHPANFDERITSSVGASPTNFQAPLDAVLRQKAVQRFSHVYREVAKNIGTLPESWREDLRMARKNS